MPRQEQDGIDEAFDDIPPPPDEPPPPQRPILDGGKGKGKGKDKDKGKGKGKDKDKDKGKGKGKDRGKLSAERREYLHSQASRKKHGYKLFISGLGKDTGKQQLIDFFESLDIPVWRAKVCTHEELQSKEFDGWVEFWPDVFPAHLCGELTIDGKLCIASLPHNQGEKAPLPM